MYLGYLRLKLHLLHQVCLNFPVRWSVPDLTIVYIVYRILIDVHDEFFASEVVLKNLRYMYNDCYLHLLAIVNQNDLVSHYQLLSVEIHSAWDVLMVVGVFSRDRKHSRKRFYYFFSNLDISDSGVGNEIPSKLYLFSCSVYFLLTRNFFSPATCFANIAHLKHCRSVF